MISVRPSITWTEESEDHIAEHAVTPDEVEQIVFTRPRYERRSRNETIECFGQTDAGRYLLVVLADSLDGGTGIVTARDMTEVESGSSERRAGDHG